MLACLTIVVYLQVKEINEEKVLIAIKNANPPAITIDEVAQETKLARQTVSKYIEKLHAEGKIKIFKKVGNVNLYQIA